MNNRSILRSIEAETMDLASIVDADPWGGVYEERAEVQALLWHELIAVSYGRRSNDEAE